MRVEQLGETLLDEGRERQSRSLGSNRGNGYSVIPRREYPLGYSRE